MPGWLFQGEKARKKERTKEREMTLTAARWKAAFLPLAHGGCLHARHLLSAAMSDLSSPQLLLDRDAAGRYVRLISATNNVESASTCLSFSLDVMAAAELVALRGCGPVPAEPLASIDILRDGADALHDLWLVLNRLQGAREHGQDALLRTEAAFGHLCAAQSMLFNLPPAAGPGAAMDQVRHAVDQMEAMVGDMKNMATLASLAIEPPLRIQWR